MSTIFCEKVWGCFSFLKNPKLRRFLFSNSTFVRFRVIPDAIIAPKAPFGLIFNPECDIIQIKSLLRLYEHRTRVCKPRL